MSACNNKQIQSTNDSSTVSKLSSARKKYFEDDFLQFFVNKPQIRSSLINRGYYIRFKAMEAVMEAWFNILGALKIEECQVVSLGAGFDSTYFRLKSQEKLPKLCKYIEVDFSEVLLRKLSSIQFHKELHDLVQDVSYDKNNISSLFLSSANYIILAADLNDPGNLHSLLVETGINFLLPTLFLAECSIAYIDVHRSDNLIKWAKETFPNSLFITYEQVYPNDGFGLIMKKHFSTIGSPLKSIDVYTDLLSQKNRFLSMGWTSCGVKGMNEFYSTLPIDEIIRIQDLELFDEYETWHQKCSHYSLTWASQGLIPLNSNFDGMAIGPDYLKHNHLWNFMVEDACSCFFRFGHQICYTKNGNLLITGGFGKLNSKHQKLRGVICYNMETMKMEEISISDEENKLGQRIFHAMVQLKDGILIYGGRSAPSNPYRDSVILYPCNDSSDNIKYEKNTKSAKAFDSGSEIELGKIKYKCQVTSDDGNIPSRWRHTVSVLEINGQEMVFLFAGSTADQKATNDCYLLDTVTWIWSKIPLQASTPTARHSHSSAVLGTNVFVSGGLSPTAKPMKSVYRFEADTLTWFKLDLNGELLPRYSHSSHIWRNRLILVGGVSAVPGHDPLLAVVNLITLNVEEFLMPGQVPEYPILLWNHRSILYKDQIVIFGGGGTCFSFGTHFNLKLLKIDLNSIPCIDRNG